MRRAEQSGAERGKAERTGCSLRVRNLAERLTAIEPELRAQPAAHPIRFSFARHPHLAILDLFALPTVQINYLKLEAAQQLLHIACNLIL